MSFRDILVHVDDAPSAASRLRAAADLARRFQAHLSGVFLASDTPPEFLSPDDSHMTFPPELLAELMKSHKSALERRSEAARLRFEAGASEAGVRSEWRVLTGDSRGQLVAAARRADLVVMSRRAVACLGRDKVEAAHLALACGGPVLVTPESDVAPSIGKRILLGWNGGREASRALRDAWPLIAEADELHVVVVSPKGEGGPDAGLQRLLEHHGLNANLIVDASPDASAGEVLGRQTRALGADLVVMGLYGRPRLQELVLGGASRDMLERLPVPLFVSH
jgi:nucleotide-binding universal stress UspA family protein